MYPGTGVRGARPGRLRALERALWVVGGAALAWCLLILTASRIDQTIAGGRLDRAIQARRQAPAAVDGLRPAPTSAPRAAVVRRPSPGDLIGRLEISKLGLSAIAREGTDSASLRRAIGHIHGTAVPPEGGNAAFAAHRDRFFARLDRLRPGDRVRLTTPEGTFIYRVEWTSIVSPDSTWVLEPTVLPTLTLVTCYPFHYVGSAPRRFVVRAQLAAR